MQWDFIIVGAGSAGCAAAYHLVKSGHKVLVLEAGGAARSPWLRIPAGVWRIGSEHDWGYFAQPDPTRNGVVEQWHRGRVLGGTSSINGMVYVRGAAGDFDRWAQHCGHHGGWAANDVMSVFRDFENCDLRSPFRGRNGPLHVRTLKHPHPVTEAFVESVCASGHPFNPDYNGLIQEGVGYLQLTQRHGLRCSAADAFLTPIRHRPNFQLRLNTEVEKVEFSGGRATSVIFHHKGVRHRENASAVVMSAGAINTPKLLMLSGIGDAEELHRHKIDVRLDLPAVGRHLKEHAAAALSYRSRVPTYNPTDGLSQKVAIAAKYLFRREGPIAAAYEAAAFLKTVPSAQIPEVQVFFAPIGWAKEGEDRRLAPYPALMVSIIRSHSVSSGRIRLASSDYRAAPIIECRLLDSDVDVDVLARGMEVVRSIMSTAPIAHLIESETSPGRVVTGRSCMRDYVRANAITTCHPMGSCRMGAGSETVVGPDLRVHGSENLWIADASIMPDAISANLNATCMMIGAKLGSQLAAKERQ